MLRRLNHRAIFVALIILFAPLNVMAAGQVGDTAANFNLNDTNEIAHTLSEHLGEVVYLFFVGHN